MSKPKPERKAWLRGKKDGPVQCVIHGQVKDRYGRERLSVSTLHGPARVPLLVPVDASELYPTKLAALRSLQRSALADFTSARRERDASARRHKRTVALREQDVLRASRAVVKERRK